MGFEHQPDLQTNDSFGIGQIITRFWDSIISNVRCLFLDSRFPGDEFPVLAGFSFAFPPGDQAGEDCYDQRDVEPYHEGGDNFHVVPPALNALPRETMSRGDSILLLRLTASIPMTLR